MGNLKSAAKALKKKQQKPRAIKSVGSNAKSNKPKSEDDIRSTILKYTKNSKTFLEFCGIDKNRKPINLANFSKKTKQRYGVVWLNYASKYDDNVAENFSMLPPLLANTGTLFVTLRQGQVGWFPRGTAQELINMSYELLMKDQLSKGGLGVRKFFEEEYVTNDKKKISPKNIVFGLKWVK